MRAVWTRCSQRLDALHRCVLTSAAEDGEERHELLFGAKRLDAAGIETADFLEVGAGLLILIIIISIVDNSIVY